MGMASESTCAASTLRLRESAVRESGRASTSSAKIFFSKRSLTKAGLRGPRAGAASLGLFANGSGEKASRPSTSSSTSGGAASGERSEEHTSELQSRQYLVCRLLLE